jgi:hypothetical protein
MGKVIFNLSFHIEKVEEMIIFDKKGEIINLPRAGKLGLCSDQCR